MAAKTAKLQIEVVPVAEVPTEDLVAVPKRTRPVVLIVDDERVIADTLSMILSRSGFSTLTAYDGLAGFEIAQRATPDLIISDVVMPGMTGVELAIAVTQMIPTCKILLFSGQAATVDLLKEARNAGHDFTTLTKPVHPTDMLKRVSECLATPRTTFTPTHNRTGDSSRPATYLVN
ncbi:response regulator [Tunturibacter empetritectus]|uniref:CheY-like chemotaxis protein n=1 Tax=Tunturiibacter empetritectus TaxID=3069691 RepID=A0A7W8ILU0_9BACT|nr:response regulator [Edaphobacter lichenicola]MBB5318548.1 CheY-like chemotaxis protein [Edaphobacter lichenicola]